MDDSNLISLENFFGVYKIGDIYERSRFLSVGEMDNLHTFALYSFVRASKSEHMHQWPMFYRACEIDSYHCFVGFLFFIFT